MNIVILCIALMGLLIFVLGANVTRFRVQRGDVGNQAPTDPGDAMFVAIRAHGNAAEYIPTLIGLLIVCMTLIDGWWLDTLAIAALVARLLHAVGLFISGSMAVRHPVKEAGALLNYAVGIALAVTVIAAL